MAFLQRWTHQDADQRHLKKAPSRHRTACRSANSSDVVPAFLAVHLTGGGSIRNNEASRQGVNTTLATLTTSHLYTRKASHG